MNWQNENLLFMALDFIEFGFHHCTDTIGDYAVNLTIELAVDYF